MIYTWQNTFAKVTNAYLAPIDWKLHDSDDTTHPSVSSS